MTWSLKMYWELATWFTKLNSFGISPFFIGCYRISQGIPKDFPSHIEVATISIYICQNIILIMDYKEPMEF